MVIRLNSNRLIKEIIQYMEAYKLLIAVAGCLNNIFFSPSESFVKWPGRLVASRRQGFKLAANSNDGASHSERPTRYTLKFHITIFTSEI